MKKICVLGGGNIGTQFACAFAAKGYEVSVHTSKPEAYDGTLCIVDADGETVCSSNLKNVTSDYEIALNDSEIVFVTYPAFMFSEISEKIALFIKKGVKIGVIPGTGGAEFAFRDCIDKGAVLFGLQRVPAVARLVTYGRTVHVEGLRERLHLASIPSGSERDMAALMEEVFGIPCEILPNYLCVTMTPSNPLLHTTRLRTLFKDYHEGFVYDRNPLFYGEWSDDSSELLLACDSEHQKMLSMLDRLDLSGVRSLREHYESNTAEQLTRKIRSIKSLHDLPSPMKQVENGWIPDFRSRYFTADFPYGLAIIEQIAVMIGSEANAINETMDWYKQVSGNASEFNLSKYGIHCIEDLYSLYLGKK